MQSCNPSKEVWVLDFIPENTRFTDPVSGWAGNSDMLCTQIKLTFYRKEDAIQYAQRNHIEFLLQEPNHRKQLAVPYFNNFIRR